MRRLLVVLVTVGVFGTAFAQADTARVTGSTVAFDSAVVFDLNAALSGKATVPGPGDPNGSGTAELRVRVRARTICGVIDLKRVPDAVSAYIRRGRRGRTGPIVVLLGVTGPVSRGCTYSVARDVLREIGEHPRRFYVNVTSESHPRGAVRGQLRPADGGGGGGGTTTGGTTGTTTGPPPG